MTLKNSIIWHSNYMANMSNWLLQLLFIHPWSGIFLICHHDQLTCFETRFHSSTCSYAWIFSHPGQWSAEHVPTLPDALQTQWDPWRSLRGSTKKWTTAVISTPTTNHNNNSLTQYEECVPMSRLFRRLCSLSISKASPAKISIGLVPSGHLLACNRKTQRL